MTCGEVSRDALMLLTARAAADEGDAYATLARITAFADAPPPALIATHAARVASFLNFYAVRSPDDVDVLVDVAKCADHVFVHNHTHHQVSIGVARFTTAIAAFTGRLHASAAVIDAANAATADAVSDGVAAASVRALVAVLDELKATAHAALTTVGTGDYGMRAFALAGDRVEVWFVRIVVGTTRRAQFEYAHATLGISTLAYDAYTRRITAGANHS